MTPIYTFQLTGYFIEPGQARCQAQLRTLHYIIDKVDFRRVTTKMMIRYRADCWGRLINRRTDMPLMCELLGVHPKDKKTCRCINGNRLDYRRSNWYVEDVAPAWLRQSIARYHGRQQRQTDTQGSQGQNLEDAQSQGADCAAAGRASYREPALPSHDRNLKAAEAPAQLHREEGPDSATKQLHNFGQRL